MLFCTWRDTCTRTCTACVHVAGPSIHAYDVGGARVQSRGERTPSPAPASSNANSTLRSLRARSDVKWTAGGACWGLTRSTLAACVSLLVWCDCRTQKALWNNLDAAWCRMAESIQSPLMRVSLKLTDALSNMRLKYVSPPLFVFPVVPSHTRFSYLSLSHARISACLAP